MDAGRPVGVRTRALAAADRLVVGEAIGAEDDVVHRPLALRGHRDGFAERREDDVRDAARRLGVPRRDRRRRQGVDETPLRRAHADRLERASGGRQVGRGEAADDVEARRARHGQRAVQVPRMLRRGSREVDVDGVAVDGDGCVDLELAVGRLEGVDSLVAAVRERADRGAHDALGVVVERVHRVGDAVATAAGAELRDTSLREAVRSELRAEVAAPLVRVAHPRHERGRAPRRRASSAG